MQLRRNGFQGLNRIGERKVNGKGRAIRSIEHGYAWRNLSSSKAS